MPMLIVVAAAVFLLNIPFGYWRGGRRRFSPAWFLAVHLPVPAVVALRLITGLGFKWETLVITIGSYFLGQFLGGRLWKLRRGSIAGDPVR
ncbi:MAG: hypothetical protein GF355_11535 [Candidatus Eisenbacteria bacterium]|nr:hypothetical protein [Candidatus Eisenbacteria bacterium]